MDKVKIAEILKYVVTLLVQRDFAELKQRESGILNESDYLVCLDSYPGSLTMPPDDDFINFNFIPISENEWAVEYDLWVDNAQSDLTLKMEFLKKNGKYQFLIDDIHVL